MANGNYFLGGPNTMRTGPTFSQQYGNLPQFNSTGSRPLTKPFSSQLQGYRGAPTTTTGKEFDFSSIGGGIAGGVGMFAKGVDPDVYDEKIGAYKPNHFGTMYGNNQGMQIGSMFGPWGTLIGAVGDRIRNAITLGKKKTDYSKAVSRYKFGQNLYNKEKFGLPNYIGTGRYGMAAQENIPIEVEKNEVGIRKGNDGKYKVIWETGPNAKTHEQKGVPKLAKAGDLIFNQEFKPAVIDAINREDYATVDQLAEKMMVYSTAASLQNLPYSNQSATQQKLNELVTGKYGAKVPNKYSYGGMIQSANPYMPGIPQNPNFNPVVGFEDPVIDQQAIDVMPMYQQQQMYRQGGMVAGPGNPPYTNNVSNIDRKMGLDDFPYSEAAAQEYWQKKWMDDQQTKWRIDQMQMEENRRRDYMDATPKPRRPKTNWIERNQMWNDIIPNL